MCYCRLAQTITASLVHCVCTGEFRLQSGRQRSLKRAAHLLRVMSSVTGANCVARLPVRCADFQAPRDRKALIAIDVQHLIRASEGEQLASAKRARPFPVWLFFLRRLCILFVSRALGAFPLVPSFTFSSAPLHTFVQHVHCFSHNTSVVFSFFQHEAF